MLKPTMPDTGSDIEAITAHAHRPKRLMGPGPSAFNWSPVGSALAYVGPQGGHETLWLYGQTTDEKKAAARKHSGRSRSRTGRHRCRLRPVVRRQTSCSDRR